MKPQESASPAASTAVARPGFADFASGSEAIAMIGLGYVGLPLAVAFARKFRVIGFDINAQRVSELREGVDRTREVTKENLMSVRSDSAAKNGVGLEFSCDPEILRGCRLIIVTVPTPIDGHKRPDLTPLVKSSTTIGRHLTARTTVVYESTVYPGCTEDDCVPIIERESGMKWGRDFFVGYSPERINPGDKEHTVDKIKKVVSGDNPVTAGLLRNIYGAVITAGIFVAATIKTAEAAKVIENTQRDLNIALMNELALIFDRMGIRTLDVLEAAGTKWNFLPFRPGLVGGHCIGVDPYYLTHKAESLGYHPQVILAGRRINDGMGKFIAEKTVKLLIANDRPVKGAKVLILGWTFKEDVPDIRNTRVIDIYQELQSFGVDVSCYDPEADAAEVKHEYGIDLVPEVSSGYEAVVLAVKHRVLQQRYGLPELLQLNPHRAPVIVDVKGFYKAEEIRSAGWQL
ncbi:MAG: nucleotide sugar dehydrogenase [Opitutae bacterium]|nr:nucleotide sugar dehydrogenase [Opitutae bacterium]